MTGFRPALAILAGEVTVDVLADEDLDILGYSPDKARAFLPDHELKHKAVCILGDAFEQLFTAQVSK